MALWTPKCGDDFTVDSAQFQYCAAPSPALAFSILFTLVFLGHVIQAFVYRKRYAWVVCMAAGWEVLGFGLRTYATVDQTKFTTSMPSQLLILLAPIWVNAFVYMVFGRMVYFFLPEQKIAGISAQRMALCFVLLDILSFIIQAAGGILTDNDDNTKLLKIGLNTYTAGIAVQQVFIIMFFGVAIYFHVKMRRGDGHPHRTGWTRMIFTIYTSLAFITIRVIYRLIEFQGSDLNSPLRLHEYYFYVLEAGPMCFALFVWNLSHPGTVLVGPDADFPKKLSKKERNAARKREEQEKYELQRTRGVDSSGYAPLETYEAEHAV